MILHYKDQQVVLFWEIIAFNSEIHSKYVSALRGKVSDLLLLKQSVPVYSSS
jgi:hypothetical protein